MAAKRQAVERHVALLSKASLHISHLEILPFSFMRLLQRLNQMPKEKTVGVVDVDGSFCTITLIKKGLPYLVRHVSLEAAPGAPEGMEETPPPSETPSSPQDPLLEKLLDEVRLTLRYYRNQFPSEEVERLLFFGDRIKPGNEETFSKELKLPIHFETLSSFTEGGGLIPSRLARTIGLSLRGMLPFRSEIDLLPRQLEASKTNKLLKTCALEVAGALVCLLALSVVMGRWAASQQRLLDIARESRVGSPYNQLSLQDLKAKQETVRSHVNLYRNLFEKRLLLTKKLSFLGAILPQGGLDDQRLDL